MWRTVSKTEFCRSPLRVAAAWGRQQYAQPLPVIDALIAATARVHGMTVVTRNVKHFELAGVQVLNPFTD
jgi:predicted nucleic acid-binding protein